VPLAREARLAPLALERASVADRALDVDADVRQEEVRDELAALDREPVRLVLPADAVLVEERCELCFDGVRELRHTGVIAG
jgi:hypothetical protein